MGTKVSQLGGPRCQRHSVYKREADFYRGGLLKALSPRRVLDELSDKGPGEQMLVISKAGPGGGIFREPL